MEKEIEELRKEVDELNMYAVHCTNVIQDLIGIVEDMLNGSGSQSDIDTLKNYVHENI